MKPLRVSPASGSLSASSAIRSAAVTSAGASERDMTNLPGSRSLRALTWPKASSTPCFARMRLPATTSSISPLLAGSFLFAIRGRGRPGHVDVVTRHDAHVDHADVASPDRFNPLLDRRLEVGELRHWTDANRALRAR